MKKQINPSKSLQSQNEAALFFKKFRDINPSVAVSGKTNGGRPAKLSTNDIIAGLTWHVIQQRGTFSCHVENLTGIKVSESALSERRQSLGMPPWRNALDGFLAPIADIQLHSNAFYKGLRLIGVDGTTLNVANTPPVKKKKKKTKSRKGKSAFFRIGCAVAFELGTHNPLAVRIGENNESEAELAGKLIEIFELNDLVIADRYYGNGKWIARLINAQCPFFLVRVKECLRATTIQILSDGSHLVKIKNPDTGEDIIVRQIKAKVRRGGKKWVKVRFWTNLLDHKSYPAKEVIALYAMRWEHEIAFYEIKQYLYETNLLLSHTITTAVQEICALFMAQAVIASIRSDVACKHDIPIMQISFAKTVDVCRNLCWFVSIAKDILTPEQITKIMEIAKTELTKQISKPRRKRGCQRKIRQPVSKWPRLRKNYYDNGDYKYEIRKS